MKRKLTLETFVYAVLVIVCVAVLALIWISMHQFSNTRPVYQGF